MEHNNQITTSWSLLQEPERKNSFHSLEEENQALRAQVAELQQSENQLQKDLRREKKKRRARSKAYLDCMNLLMVETFKLEVCKARWAAKIKDLDVSMETEMDARENIWWRRVKELERERQVDKERLQKMEEKRRMTETRANKLICKFQSQIQNLDQPPQVEGGACARCQSELERAESRWKNKLSELNASTERELAFRDDVWRRRVKELEQEKRRDMEEWQRKEGIWKRAETWENNLICELQQQVQLLKEERDRQRDSETQKKTDWWMNENQLTYQLWA